jgi:TonB family protein
MHAMIVVKVVLALAALPPLPSDTPPAPPMPAAQLASIKNTQDLVAAMLLEDGRPAPAGLTLPRLDNRRHMLAFLRVNYPESMQKITDGGGPVAWLFVRADGRVGDVRLLGTTGHAELDSLALSALRMAEFQPARVDDNPVGVWLPYPARVPSYDQVLALLETDEISLGPPPAISFTEKPVLLNRAQVEAALTRLIDEMRTPAAGLSPGYAPAPPMAGGTTDVQIFINVQGVVKHAVVKKSSGDSDLDDVALQVARLMRFSPARDGDRPVEVWLDVPVKFEMTR